MINDLDKHERYTVYGEHNEVCHRCIEGVDRYFTAPGFSIFVENVARRRYKVFLILMNKWKKDTKALPDELLEHIFSFLLPKYYQKIESWKY